MLNLKMTKDQADKARESALYAPAEVLPEGSYAVRFTRGSGFHSNTSQSYTSFFTFEVVDHSEFRHKTGEFAIVRLRSDGQPVVNRQGVMFAEGQFINLMESAGVQPAGVTDGVPSFDEEAIKEHICVVTLGKEDAHDNYPARNRFRHASAISAANMKTILDGLAADAKKAPEPAPMAGYNSQPAQGYGVPTPQGYVKAPAQGCAPAQGTHGASSIALHGYASPEMRQAAYAQAQQDPRYASEMMEPDLDSQDVPF